MILIALLILTLAGCTTHLTSEQFPELCDIKQSNKENTEYTKGTFPCKLTRHMVPMSPTPPQAP